EVTIQIDARTEGDGGLHYFWSGSGLSGSLEGSASLQLTAQASAMLGVTTRPIYVVVQDEHGAAAAIRIELDSTLVGGFAAFHASTQAAAGADATVSGCLAAHAACVVTCDAAAGSGTGGTSARFDCLARCGVQLAGCESH